MKTLILISIAVASWKISGYILDFIIRRVESNRVKELFDDEDIWSF